DVNTGASTLGLSAGVPLARTSGKVVGRLEKGFATGPAAVTFEIGSATDYLPVSVAFGNVSAPGRLAVSTLPGEPPAIATSGIDATKSVNRYDAFTNTGLAFDSASVVLTYPAADVDPGANPSAFIVRKFDAGTWTPTTTGVRTATSTQASGIKSF